MHQVICASVLLLYRHPKEARCLPVCVVKRLQVQQRAFGCGFPRLRSSALAVILCFATEDAKTPAPKGLVRVLGAAVAARRVEQRSIGRYWSQDVCRGQSSNKGERERREREERG